MQNRFGFKDFVLMTLVLLVGISVWLCMGQIDRQWNSLQQMQQSIAELRTTLERGVAVAPGPGPAPVAGGDRDESWARRDVDVDIAWQEPWTFATDPRSEPGYQIGGEFVEIFEAQPNKIVPQLSEDVYGRRVIDRVCESLGSYDPSTLRMRGVLADAWQMAPDGRWLRVHLNPRAVFSDGMPVTAEDVRYTFKEVVLNPQFEADSVRSSLDAISDVRVVDSRTVEFTYRRAVFSNLDYTLGVYVIPKHYYAKFDPTQLNQATGLLMGSGPYRVKDPSLEGQWRPPADIELVRNERYWGDRTPLDGLRYKVIIDETARLTAYRNGEGDMMVPSSPQFARVSREPGWEEENYSLSWPNMRSLYAYIGWQCGPRNGKLTPFADRRVRMAMTHLLDRQYMIDYIWEGIGSVSVGPCNPGTPGANPDVKPWPYDLQKAKALLAEAGWNDDGTGVLRNAAGEPFEFEFTRAAGGESAERIGAYVRDQCAKAGIRCTVRVVDWAAYDGIEKSRDFDALIAGWSPGAPESDPQQIWHSASIEGQGQNFVQWRNAESDRLIDAIRGEMDAPRRLKLWHQWTALVHEEQPYTFIRVSPWLRMVKRKFGNVHPYKTGIEPWEFFLLKPGAVQVASP